MLIPRPVLLLGTLFGLGALALAAATRQDEPPFPSPQEQDRATLVRLQVGTSGPELLRLLRSHAGNPAAVAKAGELIQQLSNEDFKLREQASQSLVSLGSPILSLLREHVRDADPEVARRVRDALEAIEESASPAILGTAIRQLATLNPPGTTQALLDLARTNGDPLVLIRVERGLASLAGTGEGRQALLAGLVSDTPRVRWLAGTALIPAEAPRVANLLNDPEHAVRWRVALALARSGAPAGLPAVVNALDLADQASGFELEDWLHEVAGEQGPTPLPWPGDPKGRAVRQQVWRQWLANRPAPAVPKDRTLTVLLDDGIIRMLGPNNQTEWELKEIGFPLDVELMPGGRVLVAEHGANKVTIRSRKNEILWEKEVDMPLAAQRTARGTILITNAGGMVEVDGAGAERRHPAPGQGDDETTIMKSHMLKTGEIGLVTQQINPGGNNIVPGAFFERRDADGRTLGRIPVALATSGGRVDWQANGHVLIPELERNRVVEYDAAGKEVWKTDAEMPVFAMRTPRGTTVYTSRSANGAREVDTTGKTLWSYKTDSRVTRAIRQP